MKVSFLVYVSILLFQQIVGEISKRNNERKRILVLGENNLEKERISNIILRHQDNGSIENLKNISSGIGDKSVQISLKRGGWMGNREDLVMVINIFNLKSDDIIPQYFNLFDRNIHYLHSFIIVFKNASMTIDFVNLLSSMDDMYGNKFCKHVLVVVTSNTNCAEEKDIVKIIWNTFYIDISEDIICLKLFNITSTENHTNFTKAWNFLKDQERISLRDVQDEVDMKLTKALRLQTFIESFLFQNSNFTK